MPSTSPLSKLGTCNFSSSLKDKISNIRPHSPANPPLNSVKCSKFYHQTVKLGVNRWSASSPVAFAISIKQLQKYAKNKFAASKRLPPRDTNFCTAPATNYLTGIRLKSQFVEHSAPKEFIFYINENIK